MTSKEYQQRRDAILRQFCRDFDDFINGRSDFEPTEAMELAIDNLFLELIDTQQQTVWASDNYFAAQKDLRQELRNIIKGDQDEFYKQMDRQEIKRA